MFKYTVLFLCLLITPWICLAEDPENAETAGESMSESMNSATPASSSNIKYVDDKLLIMMRAGNSNKHKIVRHLPSGTALEVLEVSEEYSKVRTRKGTEGWVLNQYLSDEPIARDRLAVATQKNARLEAQNSKLKKELSELTRQHEQLVSKSKTLTSQLQQFRSVAAKPIKLSEENTALTKAKVDLENKADLMEQEIQVLRDQSAKQWFIAGAGVLFFGVIMGLIIPKMRRRRQSDWSSL